MFQDFFNVGGTGYQNISTFYEIYGIFLTIGFRI